MNSQPSSTPTPDDIATALKEAVADDQASATLVLAWKDSPPHYELKRPLLDQGPQDWFLERTREQATVFREKRSLLPYDPEFTPKKHEALFAPDISPLPGETLFAELADYPNIPVLQAEDLKRPTMYVVVIASPAGTAYFGKRMQGLYVLSGSGTRRLQWSEGRFSEMDASVATFSERFDWALWDGSFLIDNLKAFHAEFRDNEQLKHSVEVHATTINAAIAIEGFDQFVDRCQRNVGMAAKLERVAAKGIYKEPIEKLKEYSVESKLAVTWNGDALVFDGSSIDSQWAILKLLDEDRLRGPVSSQLYDSNSKRPIADDGGSNGAVVASRGAV